MTLRAYRRTAQTEEEDRNCTETSKQATHKKKAREKTCLKMAHDTVADQASPMPDPPPFVHIKEAQGGRTVSVMCRIGETTCFYSKCESDDQYP